jgi:hypothetical protein
MFSRILTQSAVAAYAVSSLFSAASCGPTSSHSLFERTPAEGIDLKPIQAQLSPNTKIYLQGTAGYTNYTVRWSNLEPPTPNVVIAVGTEQDVAKIVSNISETRPILAASTDTPSRSNSRLSRTFPSWLTTATMVPSLLLARWTTALRSTYLS